MIKELVQKINLKWFGYSLWTFVCLFIFLEVLKIKIDHDSLGVFLSSSIQLLFLFGIMETIVGKRIKRYSDNESTIKEILQDFGKFASRYVGGTIIIFASLALWVLFEKIDQECNVIWIYFSRLDFSLIIGFYVYFFNAIRSYLKNMNN